MTSVMFSMPGCGKVCISSMGTGATAMLRSDRLEITGLVMKTGAQESLEPNKYFLKSHLITLSEGKNHLKGCFFLLSD